mgnify:FL=1
MVGKINNDGRVSRIAKDEQEMSKSPLARSESTMTYKVR